MSQAVAEWRTSFQGCCRRGSWGFLSENAGASGFLSCHLIPLQLVLKQRYTVITGGLCCDLIVSSHIEVCAHILFLPVVFRHCLELNILDPGLSFTGLNDACSTCFSVMQLVSKDVIRLVAPNRSTPRDLKLPTMRFYWPLMKETNRLGKVPEKTLRKSKGISRLSTYYMHHTCHFYKIHRTHPSPCRGRSTHVFPNRGQVRMSPTSAEAAPTRSVSPFAINGAHYEPTFMCPYLEAAWQLSNGMTVGEQIVVLTIVYSDVLLIFWRNGSLGV